MTRFNHPVTLVICMNRTIVKNPSVPLNKVILRFVLMIAYSALMNVRCGESKVPFRKLTPRFGERELSPLFFSLSLFSRCSDSVRIRIFFFSSIASNREKGGRTNLHLFISRSTIHKGRSRVAHRASRFRGEMAAQ